MENFVFFLQVTFFICVICVKLGFWLIYLGVNTGYTVKYIVQV